MKPSGASDTAVICSPCWATYATKYRSLLNSGGVWWTSGKEICYFCKCVIHNIATGAVRDHSGLCVLVAPRSAANRVLGIPEEKSVVEEKPGPPKATVRSKGAVPPKSRVSGLEPQFVVGKDEILICRSCSKGFELFGRCGYVGEPVVCPLCERAALNTNVVSADRQDVLSICDLRDLSDILIQRDEYIEHQERPLRLYYA